MERLNNEQKLLLLSNTNLLNERALNESKFDPRIKVFRNSNLDFSPVIVILIISVISLKTNSLSFTMSFNLSASTFPLPFPAQSSL